jgi:hypothetical protein
MNCLCRSTTRLARTSYSSSFFTRTTRLSVRPYASQSYGGDHMSGHPKSDQPNPKADLEHPGPESPASKGKPSSSSSEKSSSSSSSTSSTPSSSKTEEGSKNSYPTTSHGGRPAINNPGPAPENASEEVRKHNEEVANSHDRPANQIDEDGKVEKSFWKGEFCPALPFHFAVLVTTC